MTGENPLRGFGGNRLPPLMSQPNPHNQHQKSESNDTEPSTDD